MSMDGAMRCTCSNVRTRRWSQPKTITKMTQKAPERLDVSSGMGWAFVIGEAFVLSGSVVGWPLVVRGASGVSEISVVAAAWVSVPGEVLVVDLACVMGVASVVGWTLVFGKSSEMRRTLVFNGFSVMGETSVLVSSLFASFAMVTIRCVVDFTTKPSLESDGEDAWLSSASMRKKKIRITKLNFPTYEDNDYDHWA